MSPFDYSMKVADIFFTSPYVQWVDASICKAVPFLIRSESNEFADFGLVVLIKRIDDGESRFMVFEPYPDQGGSAHADFERL